MREIQWAQLIIAIFQVVGIPILLWIANILRKMYKEMRRDNRLSQIKIDALVSVLDKRMNNNFKQDFLKEVELRKSDYKFIFKDD